MATPIPVFDGHNDALMHYFLPTLVPDMPENDFIKGKRSFFERSQLGHIDLPRAREGGLGGGFFAVSAIPEKSEPLPLMKPDEGRENAKASYEVPLPPPIPLEYAQKIVAGVTALLFRMEAEANGQIKVIRTADELAACLRDGVVAIQLHFEGAEAIDTDFHALDIYYRAGLRSLGIVWSRPNAFGHGVPFKFPSSPDTGPGLTDAGKELVRACNRLGVMVDVSHLNEKGFWDVAQLTDAPIVATHSNAHALCPVTRNLTDKQLDAIKESDGMVGLNFHVGFLREDGKNDPNTPLDVMVRQIDYLVGRIGIDRVGFGSDFDGALMPKDIPDASKLPKLIDALGRAGYDDASLRKLAHENWMRVLRKTWKPA